jgi:glycosyltransferase involved in cell wall biosynthesis
VGNCDDVNFNMGRPNYLGEWTKATLYENLTNYANLFLFSEGEADPLVVKEALIAGLGVVINSSSAANLDLSKDFITVVDDDKIDDLEYIFYRLEENKSKSAPRRKEIREYGVANFDISVEVNKYLDVINEILPKTTWQLPSLGTHIDLRKLYLVDHRKKATDSSL